ncbi:conserved hypothetical protein [Vibrio nigripulchritudo SOn1]|uniref:SnoaL-like domain-containing protein n=1 Tax=Vibrio nigripulchritudo SOn1 TaxID=1238450 RepID=A0AAV2VW22_9VIBR|nr:nuclear transport factor 2 family protein [Vibrio nigripulchritudo]CCO48640.1 conserved hypothetical protein [Vibrio nigripulchritudo SOn1]
MSKKLILSSLIMAALSGTAIAQQGERIYFPGEQRVTSYSQQSQAHQPIRFPGQSYQNRYRYSAETMASMFAAEGFYQETLIEHKYDTYYNYIDRDVYIQHSPDYPDGAEPLFNELTEYLQGIRDTTEIKVLRTIAEDDYVAIHSSWATTDENGEVSTDVYIDIWRTENGKLVEHWDHYQTMSPNLDFTGPEVNMNSNQNREHNRKRALYFVNTYNNLEDSTKLEYLLADNFIAYTADAQISKFDHINSLEEAARQNKRFVRTPAKAIAMGDMALVHSKHLEVGSDNEFGTGHIDIFRFNNSGKIVEQWNIAQDVKSFYERDAAGDLVLDADGKPVVALNAWGQPNRRNNNDIFAYPYKG